MNILKNKGISVIEILIVVSIIGILAAIVLPSLSLFRREQTLNNTTGDVVSLLNSARNNTISSLSSNNYGVHFQSDRATYFTGSVFNSGDATNVPLVFDSSVTIPSINGINLNGGGSDVIFTRLTGDTPNYGTIIVALTSDSTRKKTISISKTGSISSN